ncbi:hypothetical protein A3D09_03535 [Candidatus Collierbacteria bacterium RIFCSPHIGHO2_02_FULL_49_10]|uniref:Uncharacterized protein n=1 Tax=Candidatus Collierbacteria bacterium RIFCSPHIGHO2_02_FULL_49_10 TaxID=1817723 RepID=A0A1F5EV12_9BACT|nr:MAG: hypothetical protein A3D09_03535 [Candidatus Collierbacteria bacterium RIFCSPHIGHO2_02_FULL_49_10]
MGTITGSITKRIAEVEEQKGLRLTPEELSERRVVADREAYLAKMRKEREAEGARVKAEEQIVKDRLEDATGGGASNERAGS